MKALLLAAGFGTRLRPITEKTPKALVPVLNVPLIEYGISFLKHHGITEIFINLHHLPDRIREHLGDGERFGVKITYLFEKEILGTGGSIASMKSHVSERFLVMNSDVICDFDLEAFVDRHIAEGALVTLGLVEAKEGDPHAVVTVDADGRVIRLLEGTSQPSLPSANAVFTGIHLIEPRLFDYLPAGIFYSITSDVYQRLVHERSDIRGQFIGGRWHDAGTPETLVAASFDLLSNLTLSYPVTALQKSYGLSSDQLVLLGKRVKAPAVPINPPVAIGNNCKMTGVASLGPWLVVGDKSHLSPGAATERAIYLPGADGTHRIDTPRGALYY